jgi:transposase
VCPDCSGEVLPARKNRKRTVEDIKPDAKSEAVEYTIPQQWCANCKKHVEPGVAAAMPGATIGNSAVAFSAVMHYGLGLTLAQVQEIFSSHLRTELSAGGLVDMWQRAGEVLTAWYEQIGEEAKNSATLHADETSWRVSGDTHWLWCFCNHRSCFYLIDESRGGDVLNRFFETAYAGVLLSDFWRPYQSVKLAAAVDTGAGQAAKAGGERQACLVHLLREISHVTRDVLPGKSKRDAGQWIAFALMLKRLLKDGIRLRQREDFTPELYGRRITLIDRRLIILAEAKYDDPDATRLAARLSRHRDEIFTFLDRPEAPWENNFAERQIRPAVILRKNSQCNRSERGAATQAVLMSVYRTLKLRGHDPRTVIEAALRTWSETGKLPPLPAVVVGIG